MTIIYVVIWERWDRNVYGERRNQIQRFVSYNPPSRHRHAIQPYNRQPKVFIGHYSIITAIFVFTHKSCSSASLELLNYSLANYGPIGVIQPEFGWHDRGDFVVAQTHGWCLLLPSFFFVKAQFTLSKDKFPHWPMRYRAYKPIFSASREII